MEGAGLDHLIAPLIRPCPGFPARWMHVLSVIVGRSIVIAMQPRPFLGRGPAPHRGGPARTPNHIWFGPVPRQSSRDGASKSSVLPSRNRTASLAGQEILPTRRNPRAVAQQRQRRGARSHPRRADRRHRSHGCHRRHRRLDPVGLPVRPKPVRIRRPGDSLTPEEIDLREASRPSFTRTRRSAASSASLGFGLSVAASLGG